MNGFFNVSSSPHVRSDESTATIMYEVIIALLPAALFGIYRFGAYSAAIMLIAMAFAVLSEYAFQKLANQKVTIMDGSALLTGMLVGMNMPATVPLWMPALGSVFAIIFVKQIFGGLGQNFMNPALGARCFLLISFTGLMSDFAVDGMSSATPLSDLAATGKTDLAATFLGLTNGVIGEVSAIALLIGGIYLIVRKVITWHIPVCYILSFVVFAIIFSGKGFNCTYLASEVCSGGLLLGAFFMATDYVSSPITEKGKIAYGILLGVLTGLLRLKGSSAEGVSYAIILSNLLVPQIERFTMPTAFGFEPNAIEGKKGIEWKHYRSVGILLGITLVSGLALGGAYQLTKDRIAQQELAAEAAAFASVAPDADSFGEAEALTAAIETLPAADGTVADGKFGKITYNDAYSAMDASGEVIGYIVNVTSGDGFGGDIEVSVGISVDGATTGLEFLTINETAGLGMRATEPEFKEQYVGKTVDSFSLVKGGGASADNEINALSGASFTSTAVTNAVNAALYLVQNA